MISSIELNSIILGFDPSMFISRMDKGKDMFTKELDHLRALSASRIEATRQNFEKLEELDDLDLSKLKVPQRALRSAPGAYGAAIGGYGGYGGYGGWEASTLQDPEFPGV